jgi:hypothetical protein
VRDLRTELQQVLKILDGERAVGRE